MTKPKKKNSRFLLPALLLISAILTGCGNRGGEFLLEETQEESLWQEDDGGMEEKEEEPVLSQEETDAPSQAALESDEDIPEKSATPAPEIIYVDVCGAVVNPGVFILEAGSRIFQAVEAAGGYLPEAAQNYLNRARCLTDGQQIYVPTQEEVDTQTLPVRSDGEEILSDSENVSQADGTGGDSGETESSGKINLNTADAAQLTTLNGIGETPAGAIIAYREANGPFSSIEDIMKVEGIKEGTFEKIKDQIAVE